jgi:hypothetical protein
MILIRQIALPVHRQLSGRMRSGDIHSGRLSYADSNT